MEFDTGCVLWSIMEKAGKPNLGDYFPILKKIDLQDRAIFSGFVLGLYPPVPLLLPYKATSDVEINSYKVPEGAQVLVNVWAIGRDGTTWDDPNSFVPERFLGSDVDVRGRDFELIPFEAGQRICPGFPLSMRMLYLMLGTLIHSFDWKLEGGVKPEKMDMDDKFGITLQRAQPLLAVPRCLII
ncbi:hypothetical protein Ddye_030012 [Dipteronia dyeriana]|uniref:Cytochrome P450 76AD1-like protein n=1 Tax=Dipteronia dyeriana TaxID=168575 RepID=A0AAD9WM97_9ROSI|nr:hypothetical protein Ddye_030012 [Dipteronia dyeriana]